MVRFEWSKGTGFKKYRVVVTFPDKSHKIVQFGDRRYEQYKDSSPLGLWSHLDHGDKTRRTRYKKRHGAQGHQRVKYSAAWFSWHYLW